MTLDFKSKALEINLSNTKQDTIELPEDHKYFLDISESYYGINNFTKEFFNEIHHKYPNFEDISHRFRIICVGDYWLYARCDCADRALGILIDIFESLMEKPLGFDIKKDLLRTLIEFVGILINHEKPFVELIGRILNLLKKYLDSDRKAVLINSDTVKQQLSALSKTEEYGRDFIEFYAKMCRLNIEYWDEQTGIEDWLKGREHLFSEKSLQLLTDTGKELYQRYYAILDKGNDNAFLEENIPLYFEFSNFYRKFIDRLVSSVDKFHYLVFLLDIECMSHQKDHLMYDLNVVLSDIFKELEEPFIKPFLDDVFEVFSDLKKSNKLSVLECCRTIGTKLSQIKELPLCHYFAKKTIELGFISPGPSFHTDEWRLNVDPAHVVNIRTWLDIFESDTSRYEMILAGLTANLKLGGVLIFDTDLFQKDVSRLLNCDIKRSYKLVKQLCRIFPIYFNEIGAEGELRDVSTIIDELSYRQDRLIHFLRKQVHTESNNTHIELTRKIFMFWVTKNTDMIKDLIHKDVLNSIDAEGDYVSGEYDLINKIALTAKIDPAQIIDQSESKIKKWVTEAGELETSTGKRLILLCRLYNILVEKYSFSTVDIVGYLRKFTIPATDKIDQLEESLKEKKVETALKTVFEIMEQLNNIIFSENKTEGWENIYYKRHVAYGIPSMYGAYREERFESMGKIFKLEHLAIQLIMELKNDINLSYITADSLEQIFKVLQYYQRGLKIDGISIKELDHNMEMFRYSLTSKSFSLHQYINMFRFISESIREIIKRYFFKPYDNPLKIIIPQLFDCTGLDQKGIANMINGKSEEFYREMLSNAFLLQGLDAFISVIITAMNNMVNNYPPEMIRDIMSFDKEMIVSPLYSKTPHLDNHVFLGQKAYNLKKLYLLGYPVPPGFVISTEIFRRKNTISNHPQLMKDIDKTIDYQVRKLEKLTGRQLGNKNNPLLLSVRSGSPISMPGAMNTFLNVGVNEEIIEGLSRQENYPWTAWDCYRRFLQTWGMSNGIERDVFDKIISDYKKEYRIELKSEFNPIQMKQIAHAYRDVLDKNNIYIEDDPFKQLRQTIINVFNSWDSDLARTYRKILDIADEWGTAVIVQKMVLGNLNYTSGTGVLFTRADYADKPEININGDYTSISQGEDIVGGLVNPLPVSPDQPYCKNKDISLKSAFPGIHKKIENICVELIKDHGFDHQEMEFTFESSDPDDLYILQVRNQNLSSDTEVTVFESPVDEKMILGTGIGIGNGVMNGVLIFDKEDLHNTRKNDPQIKLILVRPDTVPDDIGLIYECDGLITARGGSTSHAAVTAARLKKICIVNTGGLLVDEKNKTCSFGSETLKRGEKVALDGNKGCVYRGNYSVITLK
ncbi:MAG TPA: PEP/pyruvate-binding domain-containing protein [Clostridiales bacterium]|nr:PEP/pyruvate-binding domain-containing protein [Clostridiales bacterium]HQP69266.1 PEP/pyruvate-binding domain-containing protein [Clostridiales bacterium]